MHVVEPAGHRHSVEPVGRVRYSVSHNSGWSLAALTVRRGHIFPLNRPERCFSSIAKDDDDEDDDLFTYRMLCTTEVELHALSLLLVSFASWLMGSSYEKKMTALQRNALGEVITHRLRVGRPLMIPQGTLNEPPATIGSLDYGGSVSNIVCRSKCQVAASGWTPCIIVNNDMLEKRHERVTCVLSRNWNRVSISFSIII